MSRLVLGIGASHTTLMNTQWDKVEHLTRAHDFRNALGVAKQQLVEADPDVVVVIGSNHFRGQWLDLMPSFLLGVEQIEASGEHGTPKGVLSSHPPAAQYLCNTLIENNFDLAFSTRLAVDHGISHAVQWLMPEPPPPIIPLVINCFAPPLPTLDRVLKLGDVLSEALQTIPSVERVAVIATGGLSHKLPFPDWRAPASEDDEFLVESWHNGRGRWQDYEQRRRSIVVNAPSVINQSFDLDFLNAMRAGELRSFVNELTNESLIELAGNGGNEVRAWLVLAAALKHRSADLLAYSPMPEWLTGMAVATVQP